MISVGIFSVCLHSGQLGQPRNKDPFFEFCLTTSFVDTPHLGQDLLTGWFFLSLFIFSILSGVPTTISDSSYDYLR